MSSECPCGEPWSVGSRVPWDGEEYHSHCLIDMLRGAPTGTTRRRMRELVGRLQHDPAPETVRDALLLVLDVVMHS